MSYDGIPCLIYEDAPAAIEFLCEAFGFERQMVVEGEGGKIDHAQLTHGDGMVMLGSTKDTEYGRMVKTPKQLGGISASVYLVVTDTDAHHATAKASGAEIVMEPYDAGHGSRDYSACDLEGNLWNFGTYAP